MGIITIMWAVFLALKIAGLLEATSWWIIILWPIAAWLAVVLFLFVAGLLASIISS